MTLREDRFGNVVQASRPFSSQAVAVGPASVLMAPFAVNKDRPVRNTSGVVQSTLGNNTRHIRCVGTVSCWVAFGVNPVAALRGPNSMFIPAGLPEYFWVRSGEQLAVIQDSAAGFFYVTELDN